MKILYLVNASPWGASRSGTALRLLHATLEAGHEVPAVYFRGDGVYHALPGRRTDAGAQDLHEAYADLARSRGVALLLCSAAAARRLPAGASGDVWREAGLVEWLGFLDASDRVVRV